MQKRLFIFTHVALLLSWLSPMITETPKYFCEQLSDGQIKFGGIILSSTVFFYSRLFLIFFAAIITISVQYLQVYRPNKKLESIRSKTFDAFFAPSLKGFQSNLRINIYKVKKMARCLWIGYRLEPIYHYGFEAKHRDSHLKFWAIKLMNWTWAQGNCGLAFLKEEPQLADLTANVPYEYRLTKNQLATTSYVKGIISIPVFSELSENSRAKVIGVINIDTNDPNIATQWVDNQKLLKDIIDKFENHAMLVSLYSHATLVFLGTDYASLLMI